MSGEKQYCEHDPGCRPAIHTDYCIREQCRKEVTAPDYVPLHKRIAIMREALERIAGIRPMGSPQQDWEDMAKGMRETARLALAAFDTDKETK